MTTKTIFAEIVIRAGEDGNPFAFYAYRQLIGTGGVALRSLITAGAADRGLRVYDAINGRFLVGDVGDLDDAAEEA